MARWRKILASYFGPNDAEKAAAREERISHRGQVGFYQDDAASVDLCHIIDENTNRSGIDAHYFLYEAHGRKYKVCSNPLFIFRQDLSPFNEIRKMSLWLTEWIWFERLILGCIAFNCAIMALPTSYDPASADESEKKVFALINTVCIILFLVECILKIIARGLFFGDAPDPCYLGQLSNIFDFAIVIAGMVELTVASDGSTSKLILVRSFRILRPLRTINRLPHLQMIVASLIDSMPRLLQWLATVLFISTLFVIVGTSIFGTAYWHRCRLTEAPIRDASGHLVWPIDYAQTRFCGGRYKCQPTSSGAPTYCGTVVDPVNGKVDGMDVWPEIDNNANADYGYSGFQWYSSGLMTIFRVATMEGWAETLYRFQDSSGDFLALAYFIGLLIYGGLVLLNLALAILWRSFEEKIRTHFEKTKANSRAAAIPEDIKALKLEQLVSTVHQIEADKKSNQIYQQMDQSSGALSSIRSICLSLVMTPTFDAIILFVILANCLVLAIDAYPAPDKLIIKLTDQLNVLCTLIFTCEAVFRMISFGFKYFQDYFNIFDVTLVVVSLVELMIGGQSTVSALRVSRLLRIFKIFGQSVPMRVLFRVMTRALVLSYNFALIVVMVLVGWSLVALHLFYTREADGQTEIEFESFPWAFIAMFQLLCGEKWHGMMVEHARGHKDSALVVVFFITVFIFCHLILMNLFLGMFVAAFAIAREQVIDDNRAKLHQYRLEAAENKPPAQKKALPIEPPPEPQSPRWPKNGTRPREYPKTCASDMNVVRLLRVKRAAAARSVARGDKLALVSKLGRAYELASPAPRKSQSRGISDPDLRAASSKSARSFGNLEVSFTLSPTEWKRPTAADTVRVDPDSEMPSSLTANLLPSPEHRTLPPPPPAYPGAAALLDSHITPRDFEVSPRPPPRRANAQVHQSPPPCRFPEDAAASSSHCPEGLRRRHQATTPMQELNFREAYEHARLRARAAPHLHNPTRAACPTSLRLLSLGPRLRDTPGGAFVSQLDLPRSPAERQQRESEVGQMDSASVLGVDADISNIYLDDAQESALPDFPHDHVRRHDHWDEIVHHEVCLPIRDLSRESFGSDVEASRRSHRLEPVSCHRAPPPASTSKSPAAGEPRPFIVSKLAQILIQQAWFEPTVILLIAVSSICLAIETPYMHTDSKLYLLLSVIEKVITFSFFFEMLVKIAALGVWKPKVRSPTGDPPYFRTAWNWLDFSVVTASLVDFVMREIVTAEGSGLRVVRAIRLLRVLRPLRLIQRNKGLKIIVEALIKSFPTLVRVLMVSSLFYVGFAILFMNLLKGELWRCSLDPDGLLRPEIVTLEDCVAAGGTWINARSNFDQIGSSLVTLLHIGTGEGWIDVMKDMVNSVGIEMQPRKNSRVHFAFMIILFLALSRFFIVNLLIGVMIDQYCVTRDIMLGLEMTSSDEKRWVRTQRALLSQSAVLKDPMKIVGMFKEQRTRVAALVTSQGFRAFIFLAILANSLLLCMLYPTMDDTLRNLFGGGSIMFAMIFNVELALKCFVYFANYFDDPWNIFDFVVVAGTNASILAELFQSESESQVIQVLQACRILRVIRLVRVCQFLRRQCATLLALIPAFMNMGILLGLLLFLYACLGVGLFGTVMPGPDLNQNANFQNFGMGYLLVLRVSTGEDWHKIMYDISEDRANCTHGIQTPQELEEEGPRGCGTWLAYPYFVSFASFVSIILMNMIIAVVLDQFHSVEQGASIEWYEDLVKQLAARWRAQDKSMTGYLSIEDAITVLSDVRQPVGFQGHGARRVRNMLRTVPLYGMKVHYRDVTMLSAQRVYCWMRNEREMSADNVKLDDVALRYWLSLFPEIPKPEQAERQFRVAHVIIKEYLDRQIKRRRELNAWLAEQQRLKEEEHLERMMKNKGARAAAALLQPKAPNRVLGGRNAAGLPLHMPGDQSAPTSGAAPRKQELRLSADSESWHKDVEFGESLLVGSGFDHVLAVDTPSGHKSW